MKDGIWRRGGLFLLGVILPLYSLIFEAVSGICGSTFFDPIPTPLHVLLVAIVPISQFLVARDLKRSGEHPRRLPQLLLGAGILVSAAYTCLFLAVMPIVATYLAMSVFVFFAAIWVLVLPVAPLLSLASGLGYAVNTNSRWPAAARRASRLRYIGAAGGLAVLLVAELPRSITMWGFAELKSDEHNTAALSLLRHFGDERLLLRAAYGEVSDREDFVGWLLSIRNGYIVLDGRPPLLESDPAREIFYRVTGKPFNAVPRPRPHTMTWLFGGSDADLGSAGVGGIADGVKLVSSTVDGTIDGDALTSYAEWTMVFENSSSEQAEARAEIRLPVDGVVSRATLWVNGEEREAAIGGRAAVRAAYQKVVSYRRDPLLVTTSGRDRALVQCFPIPANGGQMKIRIGITAPLSLNSLNEALLALPYFVEHNFKLDGEDSIWFESKQKLTSSSASLASEQLSGTHFAVRGTISANRSGGQTVRASRNPERALTWTEELQTGGNGRIVQRIASKVQAPAKNLVLLVDGSEGMESARERLATAINALPSGTSVAAVVAGDKVERLGTSPSQKNTEALRELAHRIRDLDYAGGADNARGLVAAWDMASAAPDAIVVWLHGAQPVRFSAIEQLAQRVRRRPHGTRVVSVELLPGSDRLTTAEGVEQLFTSVPAEELSGEELGLLLRNLLSPQTVLVPERALEQSTDQPIEARSSDHLARLWAAGEIRRLSALAKDAVATSQALLLAQQYRLVTAISGAVVLETDQQYQESGLEPPSPQANHPSILPVAPEPEFYLMLVLIVPCTALFLRGRMGGVR